MAHRNRVFECPRSGGEIDITVEGDGNSTTYSVHASGAQFDIRPGERGDYPLRFKVVGDWEFEDLAVALAQRAGLEVVDPEDQPDLMDPEQIRGTMLTLLEQSEAPAEVIADELVGMLSAHLLAYGLDFETYASKLLHISQTVVVAPMPPGGDA